jgi:hypothetical protein
MNVHYLAKTLGGDIIGPGKILCPGPGHSRTDRSLSVIFDGAGDFAVHSFAGDDWQTCKDHVRALLGMPRGVSGQFDRKPAPEPIPLQRSDYARSLWQEAQQTAGTPAERYLHGRGITLSSEAYSHALRFHPACPFKLDSGEVTRLPAMLGLMRDIRSNEPTGVHRTALQPDGSGKAQVRGLGNPKKMLGAAKGACIKLTDDAEVTFGLHIAEGIETALACLAMGFRPMWAALSAGGIARFPTISGIEALTIFADKDENGAGERAAREAAKCWTENNREVRIITPPIIGDFADCEVAA